MGLRRKKPALTRPAVKDGESGRGLCVGRDGQRESLELRARVEQAEVDPGSILKGRAILTRMVLKSVLSSLC